jgi:hypothetical protein
MHAATALKVCATSLCSTTFQFTYTPRETGNGFEGQASNAACNTLAVRFAPNGNMVTVSSDNALGSG